ncbi:MAG: NOB1 family endonuclease [Candidatus Hermodarchaeota archaeon]
MSEKTQNYIFDTNIFLTGIDFNLIEGVIYTTHSIIEEVNQWKYKEKNRNILNKINAAIETRKLKIKVPKDKFLKKIKEISKITGDFNALSDADKELLAISLELLEKRGESMRVYSNDYSIENVCSELEIPYSPLFKNGIESKIIWEIFCPHCDKIYSAEDLNKICEICGKKLRRRPKK